MEVRWQGHVLPYRIFDKDQRVKPTAIVENKRLRHALALVKEKQDLKQAARVLTSSEKNGYVKQPRRTYGPDFEMNKTAEVMVRPRLPKGPRDIYLSRIRLAVNESGSAEKDTVKA